MDMLFDVACDTNVRWLCVSIIVVSYCQGWSKHVCPQKRWTRFTSSKKLEPKWQMSGKWPLCTFKFHLISHQSCQVNGLELQKPKSAHFGTQWPPSSFAFRDALQCRSLQICSLNGKSPCQLFIGRCWRGSSQGGRTAPLPHSEAQPCLPTAAQPPKDHRATNGRALRKAVQKC